METRKRYGELFMQATPWNEEEQKSVQTFEKFIEYSKKYAPYLNDKNQELVRTYDHEIAFLESLKDDQKSENMIRTIAVGQELRNVASIDDIKIAKENREQEKEEQLQLKLQKRAGYTNASILIFVICNLGFFLAALLLMLQ